METEPKTQICKGCGKELPIENFRLYKGIKRLTKCRDCEKEYMKNYQAKPKAERNVVTVKSNEVMPVAPKPKAKPKTVNSYSIVKGDKTIIVDTTPIKGACKFAFDMGGGHIGPTLYVPSGVSILDMIEAQNKLETETEV